MRTRFLRRYLLASASVGLCLASALPASAQMYGLYLPARPPAPVYRVIGPAHTMPMREVAVLLRHVGFRQIATIEPHGQTFRVAAMDRAGVPVMIVLDAYDGDILNVRPLDIRAFNQRAFNERAFNERTRTVPQPSAPGARASVSRQAVLTPPRPPQRPATLAALPQKPALGTGVQPSGRPAIYPPVEPDVLRSLGAAKR